MKVKDFISVANEYRKLKIVKCLGGEILSYYDGKNTIDEKYLNKEVIGISIDDKDNAFLVYIK